MNALTRKIGAVVEVTLVAFVFVPYLTLGISRLFPRLEGWQTDTLGFPVPVLVYVAEAGLSVLFILLHRRSLADYGIQFRNPRFHLDIAATGFFPMALVFLPIGMGVDETTWGGAILLAALQVGLLFVMALLLRKKAALPALGTVAAGVLFWPLASAEAQATPGRAVALFLFYALFVAFGEEILFRGYMQSRLNEVFGKPYRFCAVPFGWGAVITALLFGLMHVGILRWILGVSTEVTLAWGLWTFFGGLVFGFVRERSGSILAPALLHGMPQAIASVAMLLLAVNGA